MYQSVHIWIYMYMCGVLCGMIRKEKRVGSRELRFSFLCILEKDSADAHVIVVASCRRRRLPVWRLDSARARSAKRSEKRWRTAKDERRQHIPVLPNGPWLSATTRHYILGLPSRDSRET